MLSKNLSYHNEAKGKPSNNFITHCSKMVIISHVHSRSKTNSSFGLKRSDRTTYIHSLVTWTLKKTVTYPRSRVRTQQIKSLAHSSYCDMPILRKKSKQYWEMADGKSVTVPTAPTCYLLFLRRSTMHLLICAIHSCFSVDVAAYTANDLDAVRISHPFRNSENRTVSLLGG